MREEIAGDVLERARSAAARGEWQVAYDLLRDADAKGLLGPADLPLLAEVAYAAGHLDVTIETWERTHSECIRAGDVVAAAGAATRVAMHLLMDTTLMAPIRGWLTRAERLLEGQGETPVHAWVAVVRSYERLLGGDAQSAGDWARRAIEIGFTCEPAAAALGRVVEARSLILQGEVRRGLALLEEAGVAVVSGELDRISTGIVYCELVCALQGLAQYDLAEEWTQAMERWCPHSAIGSLQGRCRVHRAEILRLRGSCDEAEKEAIRACEELRPYLRRELGWPLNELGRIRLLKGDLEGAEEALLAAHDVGWDPEPGLALVRLAQGDLASAVASIREALERPSNVPSKELPPNTELRRAPLLEAAAEIEIVAGDLDRARTALDELQRIATRFESKALAAGAAFARGRLRFAEGEPADAQQHFETAARLWDEVGAPHETARARRGLLEARTERTEPTTSRPCSDTFHREGDYWLLVFDGQTVRLRDLKGLHYLAQLLADPGREFHVLDLVTHEHGASTESKREPELAHASLGDAGEMLDARAKEAYRRRLAEIEEDLEEAHTLGDATRANQARAEREFLAHGLSRAVGLGGRDRRSGSASERARASVTRAVRQALTRIRRQLPALADHLDRAIRTGTYCAYLPDPRAPVSWTL